MIIAIEGIDGAGKNTLAQELRRQLGAAGLETRFMAFPQYDTSPAAQLADRALHGYMGDLLDSAHGMATLFALDRRSALEQLNRHRDSLCRFLLLDRYVASNAAYTAARLGDDAAADWVADLEFRILGLPKPSLQVLLDTPVYLAASRAKDREQANHDRTRDSYEMNADLQAATAEQYRRLAGANWGSPWVVAEPDQDPRDIAAVIVKNLKP